MNIAKPVSREVNKVSFAFYTSEDIRRLSVKSIFNPILFDNLNFPTRGGLYDLALGPFDKCSMLGRAKKHLLQAKLLLLQKGLVLESIEIDNSIILDKELPSAQSDRRNGTTINSKLDWDKNVMDIDPVSDDDEAMEDNRLENDIENEADTGKKIKGKNAELQDVYIERIDAFMRKAFSRASMSKSNKLALHDKVALTTYHRQQTLKDLSKRFTAIKKCDNCSALAPRLRKDGCSKIFMIPLSKKLQQTMEAKGLRFSEAVVYRQLAALDAKAKLKENQTAETSINDSLPVESNTILSESDDSDAELERQFEELEGETIMQSQIRTAKLGTGGLTQIIIPSTQNPASNLYLNPALVQALLRLLWHNDQRLLDLMFSSTATETTYNDKSAPLSSYEMFFFNVLIVPPTKFRPVNKMEGAMFDHPQNTALAEAISCRQRIIESMKTIKELAQNVTDRALMKMKREETLVYLNSSWIALQGHINGIIDSTYNSNTGRQTKDPPPGIRQLLEKKEGIMRKHMMGKRVNYAARSVISPDPWIETCEIGIPPVFATKLTYPEPVTPHNVKELYQNVINGPDVWPGATHVQLQDGKLQLLTGLHLEARKALASQLLAPQQQSGSDALAYASHTNKKVYRHLRNGDVLLLNRQPTLHKPSIMAHKARILPGEKTIRLHYANCNTYNADFDGDEMNVHFPQNEMARAEASFIANTNNQYLVPTDGSPLRGLIQDHVVTGVKMSARDTFLDKEYYHQLLMGSLPEEVMRRGGVQLLPPAIMKPRPLWTGKQVISTLLLNLCRDMPALNLHSASKVPGKYWGPSGLEEGTVIFCDGEMVTGSLDKSQCGASAYGLVHVYGSEIAGHLLSTLGRLFSKYLQMFAFSCRMDDLLLTKTGDKWRRDLLDKGHMFGRDVAIQYTSLDDDIASGKLNDKEVDAQLKVRLEEVLREQEKLAGLDSAMKSKMNGLTSSVISKCLPEGLVKLFPENGMQLMTVSGAKGSNVNVSQISCLLGQQELEGRRVPIMVSGKSLPSFLPFDPSARAGGYIAGRFLTGIRPQEYYFHCMAGREGLIDTTVKTSRSGYLQRCLMKHMEGFRVHYDYSVRDAEGSVLQFLYGEDSLDVIKQKHLYQFRFCAENAQALNYRFNPASALAAIDDTKAIKYGKKMAKNKLRYDPVLSKYTPSRYLGATSEHFADQLTEYVNSNPDHLLAEKGAKKNPLTGKKFQALMRLKYLRSLIDPGEAVGVLAAQSIGEPSTQMTLNTFHFAGFGAKNVTLGIPRLREIVMSASANISTPTMMLPLLSHISHKDGEKFSKDLTRLTLSAILHEVIVKEKVTRMTSQKRVRQYTIRLSLFPKSDYKKVYDLDTSQVENALEKRFTKKLEQSILRHLKKAHKKDDSSNEVEELIMTVKEKTTSTNHVDEDGDVPNIKGQKEGNDDDDNDGDATASKYNNRAKQQATYDDPDEDENAIMKAADHQVDSDEDLDEPVITKDKTEQNDSDASDMDEMAHAPKNLNDSRDRNDVDNHRKHRIANDSAYITDYKFDSVHGEWCEFELQLPGQWKKLLMVDIIEQVCHSVIIRELPGISRCFVAQNETENDKSISLATDGVNLKGLWNHTNIIDVNKIYTNDIAALYHSYGVEAARSAIIKEVAGVFDVYGISVDRRHLSLIADYMTFEGGYKPFSRLGMQTNPSPLLKMSFETTCAFLTDATLSGDFDTLKSPSARLVVGKVVESGTGCFDVLQPLT